jgi:hypothetical protein
MLAEGVWAEVIINGGTSAAIFRAQCPRCSNKCLQRHHQNLSNARAVELGENRYPVRRISKRGLRQVDFVFDGNEICGLEQTGRDANSIVLQITRFEFESMISG